jgi:hypothetical protein
MKKLLLLISLFFILIVFYCNNAQAEIGPITNIHKNSSIFAEVMIKDDDAETLGKVNLGCTAFFGDHFGIRVGGYDVKWQKVTAGGVILNFDNFMINSEVYYDWDEHSEQETQVGMYYVFRDDSNLMDIIGGGVDVEDEERKNFISYESRYKDINFPIYTRLTIMFNNHEVKPILAIGFWLR